MSLDSVKRLQVGETPEGADVRSLGNVLGDEDNVIVVSGVEKVSSHRLENLRSSDR